MKNLSDAIDFVGSTEGELRYKDLLHSTASEPAMRAYAAVLLEVSTPGEKFTVKQTQKLIRAISYAMAVGTTLGMEMERK